MEISASLLARSLFNWSGSGATDDQLAELDLELEDLCWNVSCWASWNKSCLQEDGSGYDGAGEDGVGGCDLKVEVDKEDGLEEWEWSVLVPMGIGLYLLSLMTVVGNAMVLQAIRTERRLQTVSNMFIMSLAAADLTVGVIVMPISSAYAITGEWLFGVAVCQFWLSVDYTASTASIFNLFILSLDRYWSITSPLRYLRKRTKKRALIMIGLVWMISAMWVVPVIAWHHFEFGGQRQQPPDVCETEFAGNVVFKVTTAIANFYIPTTLMVYLYGRIFFEIKKRSEFEIGHCNVGGNKASNNDDPLDDSLVEERNSSDSDGRRYFGHALIALSRSLRKNIVRNNQNQASMNGELQYQFKNLTLLAFQNCPEGPSPAIGDDNYLSHFEGVTVQVEYVKEADRSSQSSRSTVKHSSTDMSSLSKRCSLESVRRRNGGCRTGSAASTTASEASRKISSSSSTSGRRDTRGSSQHSHHRQCFYSTPRQNSATSPTNQEPAMGPPACCCESISELPPPLLIQQQHHRRSSSVKFRVLRRFMEKKRRRRSENTVLQKEKKAAKQLGVIMGAFVLCWLPYFVLFMVIAYCGDCVDPKVHTATIWLGYMNSTLNPFLYPLCNANFKRAFKRMLKVASRAEQNSVAFNLGHVNNPNQQQNPANPAPAPAPASSPAPQSN